MKVADQVQMYREYLHISETSLNSDIIAILFGFLKGI